MPVSFKKAKDILNNLSKAGGKLVKGETLKSAAGKIAPVVGASMIIQEMRDLPVLSQVMTGLDNVYEFAMKNVIEKIPVIGWAAKWTRENIVEPIGKITGGLVATESTNDRSWYTAKKDVKMPDTTDRPSGMGLVSECTVADVTGAVARMQHMNVELFDLSQIESFKLQMTNLWENITNGLRRSVIYTQDMVTVYMLNSISYYIIGKYFEKKIGFMKFSDTTFPDFREQWSLTYNQNSDAGLIPAGQNTMLDVNDMENGFVKTQEYYDYITELERNFILPKNLKEWIDHYFGSVFVIDDDVKNWKIIDVNPVSIPFYSITATGIVKTLVSLPSITIENYYNQIVDFFKVNATIRSDLNNAQVFSQNYDSKTSLLSIMALGWFTKREDYKPELLMDKSFKQALINSYTKGSDFSLVFKNNMIRFDYIDENGAGDDLTTIIFAGAAVDKSNPLLGDGHLKVVNIALVIMGSDTLPVTVPYNWVFKGIPGGNTLYTTLTKPHVAILTTNMQETDITRIDANGGHTSTETISETLAENQTTVYSGYTVQTGRIEVDTTYATKEVGTLSFNILKNGQVFSSSYMTYRQTLIDMFTGATPNLFVHLFDYNNVQFYAMYNIDFSDIDHLKVRKSNAVTDLIAIQKSDHDFNGLPFIFCLDEYTDSFGNVYTLQVTNAVSPYNSDVYNADLDVEDYYTNIATWTLQNGGALAEFDLYLNMNANWNGYAVSSYALFDDTGMNYVAASTPADAIRDYTVTPSYNNWSIYRLYTYQQPATTPISFSFNTDCYNASYTEWCHMAMGYAIPVILDKFSNVKLYSNNVWQGETLNRTFILLKEDFVPFFVNRTDLNWVLYYMYSSLCNIELLPYKTKS